MLLSEEPEIIKSGLRAFAPTAADTSGASAALYTGAVEFFRERESRRFLLQVLPPCKSLRDHVSSVEREARAAFNKMEAILCSCSPPESRHAKAVDVLVCLESGQRGRRLPMGLASWIPKELWWPGVLRAWQELDVPQPPVTPEECRLRSLCVQKADLLKRGPSPWNPMDRLGRESPEEAASGEQPAAAQHLPAGADAGNLESQAGSAPIPAQAVPPAKGLLGTILPVTHRLPGSGKQGFGTCWHVGALGQRLLHSFTKGSVARLACLVFFLWGWQGFTLDVFALLSLWARR